MNCSKGIIIALVYRTLDVWELNKHSIQDMVDLLRLEKETAVNKVHQIDTINLLLPLIDMGINGTWVY